MRYATPALFSALPVLLASCSGPPGPGETSARSSSAIAQGDSADGACQVVLRHTYIDFESSLGPQTDCSSGTCWVVVTATIDLAMSQSLAGSVPYVLYEGEGGTTWQQSAPAEPVFGCDQPPQGGACAPVGFRRYQVTLRSGTFASGPGDTTVRLIPFVRTVAGGRIFDHNRVADPLGSYELVPQNNWTVGDDASACPGPVPASRLTATFATGWQNTSAGTLAGGGKLDVAYDIYRMPQTLGCTTDGVAAFATNAFVQFEPGGQIVTEPVAGPLDPTTNRYASLPLEFDVPAGASSAALWFDTSSDCTGGTQWDSDYGRNYVFYAP